MCVGVRIFLRSSRNSRRMFLQHTAWFYLHRNFTIFSGDTTMGDSVTPQQTKCTLIYDGACRLCVKSKEGLQYFSRPSSSSSTNYIPYQSGEARHLLGPEYQPGRPQVAYLIGTDGQVYKGLDAMLPVLAELPGGWWISAVFTIPGCRPIASWVYRLVARYRYWFGAMPAKGL